MPTAFSQILCSSRWRLIALPGDWFSNQCSQKLPEGRLAVEFPLSANSFKRIDLAITLFSSLRFKLGRQSRPYISLRSFLRIPKPSCLPFFSLAVFMPQSFFMRTLQLFEIYEGHLFLQVVRKSNLQSHAKRRNAFCKRVAGASFLMSVICLGKEAMICLANSLVYPQTAV